MLQWNLIINHLFIRLFACSLKSATNNIAKLNNLMIESHIFHRDRSTCLSHSLALFNLCRKGFYQTMNIYAIFGLLTVAFLYAESTMPYQIDNSLHQDENVVQKNESSTGNLRRQTLSQNYYYDTYYYSYYNIDIEVDDNVDDNVEDNVDDNVDDIVDDNVDDNF